MLEWVFILSVFADDGISIPCSYTSYLCPVQSSKLYNEVRLCKEKDKHALNHFETPYVVHLQNKFQLAPTQPLFMFCHPNKGKIYVSCSFSVIFFLKEIRAMLVKLTHCVCLCPLMCSCLLALEPVEWFSRSFVWHLNTIFLNFCYQQHGGFMTHWDGSITSNMSSRPWNDVW